MQRLFEALLTNDPLQRERLSQALLAMGLMGSAVLAMHYFAWAGLVHPGGVWWWTLLSLGGMAVAFALVRSGWSQCRADPSLTVPQMVYAIACAALAYALLGAGRGSVFLMLMVILMFGMFVATPQQMGRVSLYAVMLFGFTMALMAWLQPAAYPPAVEMGHFVMVATMVPAVSILAARLSRLRLRSRVQRAELTAALARIRELATRDELTGLINRRHLEELMEQEHQRCIRSGHTFCVAALQIDSFGQLAQRLGAGGEEKLLRAVAQEGLRFVRVADVLAYWGGERFVLLMSDSRAALARGGLDRLREQVAAARLVPADAGLRVSLSAGLAEHHAGETVAQTLTRAEAALLDAQAHSSAGLLVH